MSDAGPLGLAPSDILAWSQLTGNHITPLEFTLLTAMDAEYLNGIYEHRESMRAKYQTDNKIPSKSAPRKKAK